jgi:hypothetical protein
MQGRYGDSITRAGERTCVYEIDMVRGKGASKDAPTPYLELQGLAALRRTCRPCLALPAFQWVLAESLWQLRPCCQTSLTHFISFTVIIKNSIPQSLASLLLLYILLSKRERLLCPRNLHCRRPSGWRGPPELKRLGLPKQPGFTNCL